MKPAARSASRVSAALARTCSRDRQWLLALLHACFARGRGPARKRRSLTRNTSPLAMHGPIPVARDQIALLVGPPPEASAMIDGSRQNELMRPPTGTNACMPHKAMAEIPTRRRSSASRTAAPEHSSAECSETKVRGVANPRQGVRFRRSRGSSPLPTCQGAVLSFFQARIMSRMAARNRMTSASVL